MSLTHQLTHSLAPSTNRFLPFTSSPETITMLFYAVAQLLLLASASAQLRGVRDLALGSAPSLGTAAPYAVLGASAITGASTCSVTKGHVGITAAPLAAVVGFALSPTTENDKSTSTTVLDNDHYVFGQSEAGSVLDEGTPAHDAKAAFDEIRDSVVTANDFINVNNGELGSVVLTPGVYNFPGAVGLGGVLTFDAKNDPTAVFIIQTGGAFTTATAASMVLDNEAKAENIYFQITGAMTAGASANLKGVYLVQAAVTLGASSLVDGSVFGQAAFTMGASVTINRQGALVRSVHYDYACCYSKDAREE
jgi:hypothetical protein